MILTPYMELVITFDIVFCSQLNITCWCIVIVF